MKVSIGGIQLFGVVITTPKKIECMDIEVEGKEVYELFKRAVKEGKIILPPPKKRGR